MTIWPQRAFIRLVYSIEAGRRLSAVNGAVVVKRGAGTVQGAQDIPQRKCGNGSHWALFANGDGNQKRQGTDQPRDPFVVRFADEFEIGINRRRKRC